MKAIEVINKKKLEIKTFPIPSVESNEILIKVYAAGVNRADIFQKQGHYPPPPGASDILGLEVAGEVAEIGKNVSEWKIGDKVCALLEGGGYAEYVAVAATQVLPIPENLNYIEAASMPEALFTVWSNLFHCAKIQSEETLLIHGGASSIGVMAIQLARAFEIKCLATAGTDAKCKFLRDLGSEKAINYKEEDFVKVIKSGAYNIDVILDIVGGDYFQKNLDVLSHKGRLVCISFLGGSKANINFVQLLLKNLTITGTTLRNKKADEKAKIALELKEKVIPLLENKKITPVIDSVFSMQKADKAHELMQGNKNIGKIVLNIC